MWLSRKLVAVIPSVQGIVSTCRAQRLDRKAVAINLPVHCNPRQKSITGTTRIRYIRPRVAPSRLWAERRKPLREADFREMGPRTLRPGPRYNRGGQV